MTVVTASSVVSYAGTGSTTAFPVPFYFIANSDIAVTFVSADGVETEWVEGSDYTLAGAGNAAGGAVTALSAPASGSTLWIRRVVDLVQPSDFPIGGPFPSRTVERGFDRLTMVAQQHDEALGRALKFPATAAAAAILPKASDLAGRMLSFDESGAPVASDATRAQIEGPAVAAWAQGASIGDVPATVGDGVTTRYATGHVLTSKAGVHVEVGGVFQAPSAYSIDGEDVVLSAPAPDGVPVHIRVLGVPVQLADASWSQVEPSDGGGPAPLAALLAEPRNAKHSYASIQAALNAGGDVYLPTGSHTISAGLTMSVAGTRLYGPGKILLSSAFSGDEAINVTADRCTIEGITLDGSAAQTAVVQSYSLVRMAAGVTGLTLRKLRATGSRGTMLQLGAGSATSYDVTVDDCDLSDSGWTMVSLERVVGGKVTNNRMEKAGETLVSLAGVGGKTKVSGNRGTKATPPTYIYDGPGTPGGAEAGGFVRFEPGRPDGSATGSSDVVVTANIWDDCLNAASDGIVLGEHTDTGSEFYRLIVADNIVHKAGGWGIDVTGNMTVTGNIVTDCTADGIALAFDYGGDFHNTTVGNNIVTGCLGGIVLTRNHGNTISYKDVAVTGNVVANCTHGFRFNTMSASFSNVLVANNDLANVTNDSISRMAGTDNPTGITFRGNILKNPNKAVSGASFAVTGYDQFTLTNASPTTLTHLTGGSLGQTITIVFGDANTTVNFRYGDTPGAGEQLLYGNGNVDYAARANDVLRCVCMGDWWSCQILHMGSRGTVSAGTVDATGVEVSGVAEWPARITGTSATATQRAAHILLRRSTSGGATADTAFLGGISIGGHNGTAYTAGYNGGAELNFRAIGAWSASNGGVSAELYLTPNGSTTPVLHQWWTHDGLTALPRTTTTASAANVYIDGATGFLYRSTSSERYKADIEPIDIEIVRAIGPDLLAAAIWYRSTANADNPAWSWYGMSAEAVAAVDPRLVHWTYPADAYEEVLTGTETVLVPVTETVEETVEELAVVDGAVVLRPVIQQVERPVLGDVPVLNADGTPKVDDAGQPVVRRAELVRLETREIKERRLRPDAQMIPDGVQYERVALILSLYLADQMAGTVAA